MDLKHLANCQKLTDEEKKWLADTAEQMGIKFAPRKHCKSCYNDLAVQIYRELTKSADVEVSTKYKLKAGVDIVWKGIRVNEATITDYIAEKMLELGLKKFFV